MTESIVIVGLARTAIGAFQGQFSALSASDLGAVAIKEAVARSGVVPAHIEQAFMGCVLPAGQGQAPARQALRKAGLADACGAVTLNKMCGSGMQAAIMAHDILLSGSAKIIVAGGMESMTNAPYLLPKARGGYRLGHGQVVDHMFFDGLEDAYDKGQLMGVFAEQCASKYSFTRQAQDEFALTSLKRAQDATANGNFISEIAPVTVKDKTFAIDETPTQAKPDKIPTLKPAFKPDGTVTAANASSISDGAAAMVLMRESTAKDMGLKPIARIAGHSFHAHEPAWFTTAPVGALQKLEQKTGWALGSVDLFEINEAFAVVTMAAEKELNLPHDKVNVHGGACALGHPIGASGARILVTLVHALKQHNKKRGMAALCIGGGEATAMAVEVL